MPTNVTASQSVFLGNLDALSLLKPFFARRGKSPANAKPDSYVPPPQAKPTKAPKKSKSSSCRVRFWRHGGTCKSNTEKVCERSAFRKDPHCKIVPKREPNCKRVSWRGPIKCKVPAKK